MWVLLDQLKAKCVEVEGVRGYDRVESETGGGG